MAAKQTIFWKIAALVILWRGVLWGIGAGADFVVPYAPSFPYAYELLGELPVARWLYSWANFDGVHYLTIAREGYEGTRAIQAFFPVFPLLLRLFPQPPVVAGLILNIFFTLSATGMMWLLARLDHHKSVALWAVISLLLFPTSFFLGALYTEALFLTLVLGSFYSARKKEWLLAALLAAVASGTRIIGAALFPALLVEWWLQTRSTHHSFLLSAHWRELTILFLPLSGLLLYMGYLWRTFGDPLFFFHVQSEFGAGRQNSLVVFPQVVWRALKILWTARPFDWKYFSYVQELVLPVGVLSALALGWKKIRPSYLVFSLVAFFLPTLTGTLSSMPRYVLACFPLFLLLGELFEKKPVTRVFLLTASGILLIINTVLFIQGYWVA